MAEKNLFYFFNNRWNESSDKNADSVVEAELELIPDGSSSGVGKVTFSDGSGLIAKRTAQRQANSICTSGFLLKSGERVGRGYNIEINEGNALSEAHTRVGHSYNQT